MTDRRWLARHALLLLLAGVVAACTGADPSEPADDGAQFSVSDEQQQATNECLEQAGLSSADLSLPVDAVGDDARRRAEAWECAVQHGTAEVDGDTSAERQATTDAAVALVGCMRAEGWTVPDPEPAPGGGLKPPSRIDLPESAEERTAFQEDFAVCQSEAFDAESRG